MNPLVDREWDDAISTHPDATIFHSTAWARVLVDTYGHRPCYVQMSLNGSLLALVPMMEVQSVLTRSRGICLPFSDYCAPLTFSSFGHELVTQKLQQIARERRWSYFELRSHSIVPDERACFRVLLRALSRFENRPGGAHFEFFELRSASGTQSAAQWTICQHSIESGRDGSVLQAACPDPPPSWSATAAAIFFYEHSPASD